METLYGRGGRITTSPAVPRGGMDCTISCECGRSIEATGTDHHVACPDCGTVYAVTITQIAQPAD